LLAAINSSFEVAKQLDAVNEGRGKTETGWSSFKMLHPVLALKLATPSLIRC
jgi:hypothetical protein